MGDNLFMYKGNTIENFDEYGALYHGDLFYHRNSIGYVALKNFSYSTEERIIPNSHKVAAEIQSVPVYQRDSNFSKEDMIRFGRIICGTDRIAIGGEEGVKTMLEMYVENPTMFQENDIARKIRTVTKDKWEYMLYEPSGLGVEMKVLVEKGEEGWEFCTLIGCNVIFKRRKL